MIKSWTDEAWEDFEYWMKQDKKTLRRILQLLKDIERNGYDGIGKPERLSGELSAYWSRRIDESNRIVYRIEGGVMGMIIEIIGSLPAVFISTFELTFHLFRFLDTATQMMNTSS